MIHYLRRREHYRTPYDGQRNHRSLAFIGIKHVISVSGQLRQRNGVSYVNKVDMIPLPRVYGV